MKILPFILYQFLYLNKYINKYENTDTARNNFESAIKIVATEQYRLVNFNVLSEKRNPNSKSLTVKTNCL